MAKSLGSGITIAKDTAQKMDTSPKDKNKMETSPKGKINLINALQNDSN